MTLARASGPQMGADRGIMSALNLDNTGPGHQTFSQSEVSQSRYHRSANRMLRIL